MKNNEIKNIAKIFLLITLPLLLIIILMVSSRSHAATNVILYDATGSPIAFMTLGEPTIYLDSGDPVGYVDVTGAVYTFSGQHVGWYHDGVLYDKKGYMVAFLDIKKPDFVDIKPLLQDITKHKKSTRIIEQPIEPAGDPPLYTNEISPTQIDDMFSIPAEYL